MTQRGAQHRAGAPGQVASGSVELAQVNIARLRYPVDAPELRDFVSGWRASTPSERSAGFVWRHPTDFGHLGGAELLDDPAVVINLSVWRSYEHLHDFTYRSAHAGFVRRRSQWFTPLPQPATALWWLPAGTRPTPEQAVARLRLLQRYGPGPQAFTPRRRFTAHGRPVSRLRGPARSGSV